MVKNARLLIVDDDDDILTAGRLLLRRSLGEVVTCHQPEDIPVLMARHDFDAIMLDMNFAPQESSGRQGLQWLERILTIDPKMVVVMITAHGGVDTVVEAMKRGATDFVAKPWENEKVVATMSAAVALRRSRREAFSLREANRVLSESAGGSEDLIGDSSAMRVVRRLVARAAPTDANVLLLGENGTGKGLIAREIHRRSARSDRVFLGVDLGAVAESLFESELFGHRKGAFTGADEDRAGRFQAAHGGTLFLDEVGNLPLHLQAKLLSAIEQRCVTPVGSDRPEPVDVRVIAATNLAPERLADERSFRQDLLFRLNTVEVEMPPLRNRREDILPIARHYLAQFSRRHGDRVTAFSMQAEQALVEDDWPGNVRALRHAVERAVILAPGDRIEVTDLQLSAPRSVPTPVTTHSDGMTLDAIERSTIHRVLVKHGFNISRAAKELGLTRASLYRRMEKHDL